MRIRADIAELLRQGLTNTDIATRCHVRRQVVAEARLDLGIEPSRRGRALTAASIEDAFRARTRPVGDGHLEWAGATDRDGTPMVSHGRNYQTARQVAFRIQYGRKPVGNVKPGCGHAGCVAPGHVEDQPMRETFAAIVGGSS